MTGGTIYKNFQNFKDKNKDIAKLLRYYVNYMSQ